MSESATRPPTEPPGPPGSFLRLLVAAMRDPLAELPRLHREYGPVVTFRKGLTFLVAHPEGIKHVLQDNHTNYMKGVLYRRALHPLMGDGLLTAEGEAWKLQRRLAQPAFLRKQHAHFAETISAIPGSWPPTSAAWRARPTHLTCITRWPSIR